LATGMQPVQDIVEKLIARNLTYKAASCMAQIWIKISRKLLFCYSSWDFAHGWTPESAEKSAYAFLLLCHALQSLSKRIAVMNVKEFKLRKV